MAEKNKVIVRISGQEYILVGTESQEYLYKVALYVDKKLSLVLRQDPTLNVARASVLTALNVGDDYLKLADELRKVNKDKNDAEKRLGNISSVEQENQQLKNTVKQLTDDLARTEKEFTEFMQAFGENKPK